MSAKVLLIDGPKRGEIYETDSPHRLAIVFPIPVPRPQVTPFDPPFLSEFKEVVYHIHRVVLFGRFILVGSTKTKPSDQDAFEALASNAAKEVALR